MTGTLVHLVWRETGPVAYRSMFNGMPYATNWIEHRGEIAPGIFSFASQLELDPTVLGKGGSIIHSSSELNVDENLTPLRYVTEARGTTLRLGWSSGTIEATLPDGSHQKISSEDATYVMESQHAGLEALLLARLFRTGQLGQSVRVPFFFVNQLIVLPYQLEAAPELNTKSGEMWYRNSFGAELLLDGEGRLLRSLNRLQGISTHRLDTAPERPEPIAAIQNYRSAVYSPPVDAPIRVEDVSIPGPVTPLGATLTIPVGSDLPGQSRRRWPAVLFISGSGTHDRNGIAGELDIGTHEIVDCVSTAGFVGLRYDTRGTGTTRLGADHLEAGLEAVIADALAAYNFLAMRPEVDPARIFLIGHSQGGTVALSLVTRHGVRACGVALLATVGRSLEEISLDQIEAHGRHIGISEEQIAKQQGLVKEMYALIRAGKKFTAGEVPDIHLAAKRSVPWMRDWLIHRADEMITRLNCPVFIANGEKDFQVSAAKDAQRLSEAAERAGVLKVLRIYPLLDHLFKQTGGDSTLASYYERNRQIDIEFLGDLINWLRQQADSKEMLFD